MKNFSKDEINKIITNEKSFKSKFVKLNETEKTAFLRKIGKIDEKFKGRDILIDSYKDSGKNLRYEIIKSLAKLSDLKLLSFFKTSLQKEEVSDIRREIVSGIGRLRNKKSIPVLVEILKDNDPNIVLQAIRGLLVFKDDTKVLNILKKLKNHENEIVKMIIENELFSKNKKNDGKHSEVDPELKNKVINGDALSILKKVPENSFHLTFTSPPYYNARDYSIYKSYDEYLTFLESIFKEVHRTTKEGRFFILNTSPIIIPRFSRSYSSKRYAIPYDLHPILQNMGWEFIDDIVWAKPEASAKNRIGGFLQHKKPLAYKPNSTTEMVMVYRKKTTKLIDWNINQYSEQITKASKVKDEIHKSNLWEIGPSHDKIHSAVFPQELCDRIIKYYSFKDDLVLDPFAGSGTFGKAALKRERNFFLIEIYKKYFEDMRKKIKPISETQNQIDFIDEKKFAKSLNL